MTPAFNHRDAVKKFCFAVFSAAILSLISIGSVASGQTAGSAHVSAAPPTGSGHPATGSVSPRTSSVSPPTSARKGTTTSANSHSPNHPHQPGHQNHNYSGTAYYPYYVPYVLDNNSADSSADDDSQYQGGPTVFDRRGSGANSYIASDPGSNPAYAANDPSQLFASPDASAGGADSTDPTTLVFKDGHQLEVENYAIVGQTLYDLTPGHPRKVPLSDLDLGATRKQNEDQGIIFQLPASSSSSLQN